MLTLNDGRTELWQWDTGRMLSVDADCSQVHFSNKVFGRSIDVDVVDGFATIPDILLQTDKELTAWAFVGTAENGYTKISKVFKVNKRNKPADYVFTPTDQTTLGEILGRIEDLENRPSGDVSEEDIQNAVNDYLDKNPISVEEKDPTVPAWAKEQEKPKYTAEEVGALPNTTAIPSVPTALPNPHKLTINGAVQAEYDGSEAVTLTIPESSYVTGDYIPNPPTASVGQSIVVKAVDENGKPTEWEVADFPSGVAEDDSFPETPQFDITVEEDCVSVLLETLNNVTLSEYGFKSMYIAVNSIAVSTAVSGDLTARVNHKANGTVHPTATVSNFLRQTSSKWWHALFDFKNENVYWLASAVSRSIDAASSFKRPGCFKKGEHAVMPITNIYVGGTTSCTIPAGTRIYIWLR